MWPVSAVVATANHGQEWSSCHSMFGTGATIRVQCMLGVGHSQCIVLYKWSVFSGVGHRERSLSGVK